MSSDLSDLSLDEEETERAIERANSDVQHRAFVANAPPADIVDEDKAQQQRVDHFIQRWSMPPSQPERAGERREFVVRAARLEIGQEAVDRANRPKEELTPAERELQEHIASKLLFEFSREMAALGTHLGVRLFEDSDAQAFRHVERVFDVAAPTWMAERARTGQKLLGGKAFGELFQKKDPRTYRLMTEGWSATFLPSSSMEPRSGPGSKPQVDENKVILSPLATTKPSAVAQPKSDSTDESLTALEPSAGSRNTTVAVVPPEQMKPVPEVAPAPPVEEKSGTGKMLAVGAIAALIAGGGGVWYALSRESGSPPAGTPNAGGVTTTVVTVVKTVMVPNRATTPSDATSGGAARVEPSATVSAPAVTTRTLPFPSVKSTVPNVATTPTIPATPTTSAAPPTSGTHTPKFGGK